MEQSYASASPLGALAGGILLPDAWPLPESARLAAQLKRHEGLRLAAYLDGEGILTIGYGHNCQVAPVRGVSRVGHKISQARADLLFKSDMELAGAQAAQALPWIKRLDYPRRAVLINMMFNMGVGSEASGRGLMGFKRMLAALREGDFASAAHEMLGSRWACQVGPRARELAAQMQSGNWPGGLHV